MRKIKRIIKKKYGRKGLRFSNDVACNMITPFNAVKPVYSFVYGIKKTNNIRNEKIKKQEEQEAISILRDAFVEATETLACLTYGCLYVEEGIKYGDPTPKHDRLIEIEDKAVDEMNKICDDIYEGKYDYFAFIPDEEYHDEPHDIFIEMISNRLLIAAGLLPDEIKVFNSIKNRYYVHDTN